MDIAYLLLAPKRIVRVLSDLPIPHWKVDPVTGELRWHRKGKFVRGV